jgi:Immunoglobulin domain
MKRRLTQTLPLLLAAALQVLPLLRTLFTAPSAGSNFAFILRWGIATGAALESVDAVSGASGVPLITTNHIYLTAGVYSSNNITFTIGGGNKAATGDYFLISTLSGSLLATLADGKTSTNGCLPVGLIFKSHIPAGATTIYGSLYGTPVGAVSTITSNIIVTPYDAANGSGGYPTNIAITILPSSSAPIITNQPITAATNLVGTTNTLFNVVAGGSTPLSYQWYFNTNTALLNQTNATLTLNNIQLTNAGYYLCTITNSAGSTNSANALLTVWQPPVITNQPVALTNNVGTTANFSITAGGTPAPAYQWYFNTNTLLTGQTAATLTLNNVQLTNAGMYSVIVTNAAGGTNSFFTPLTVWQPPVITNHPASFTIVAGGSANFSITAGGTPAPTFQWKFNTNTVLTGSTGTTLSLANLRASQAGTYSVTITNAAGVTNSFFATLTVTNPLPPMLTNSVAGGGGKFNFTFTPVAGLTNTVLTNGVLGSTNWGVFTNIPPSGATPVTLTNPAGNGSLFFKLMIQP